MLLPRIAYPVFKEKIHFSHRFGFFLQKMQLAADILR